MTKRILTFAGANFLSKFEEEVLSCIGQCIANLDFIFEQVPASFGLSKKGKQKIKEVLSNTARNEEISKFLIG